MFLIIYSHLRLWKAEWFRGCRDLTGRSETTACYAAGMTGVLELRWPSGGIDEKALIDEASLEVEFYRPENRENSWVENRSNWGWHDSSMKESKTLEGDQVYGQTRHVFSYVACKSLSSKSQQLAHLSEQLTISLTIPEIPTALLVSVQM